MVFACVRTARRRPLPSPALNVVRIWRVRRVWQGEIECVKPTSCCKMETQECCLDCRIACPCDDEVPCMLNLFGWTCCRDWKVVCECCTKVQPGDEEARQHV